MNYHREKKSTVLTQDFLFFTPSEGSIVKIINVNDNTTACIISISIMEVGEDDATTKTIELIHKYDANADEDVFWQDMKGIKFDGNQKIRAKFDDCVSGDKLSLTVGVE